MPPQTQSQGQSQSKSPARKALDEGFAALESAIDVAVNTKDPVASLTNTVDFARTAINASQNISALDSQMRKLEGTSPGTLKAISTTSQALDSLAEMAMPLVGKVPGIDPKLLGDLKQTSESFEQFAKAYDAYDKTTKDWIPFNEISAGRAAVKEWSEFKQDFDNLESHIPGPLKGQTGNPTIQNAANGVLDVADTLIDTFLK